MSRCSYFKTWGREIPRRTSSSSGKASPLVIKVSYCSHKRSPVTLEMAQRELGDGANLKCAGFVRRCPLPEGVRPVPPSLEYIQVSEPTPDMREDVATGNIGPQAAMHRRRGSGG